MGPNGSPQLVRPRATARPGANRLALLAPWKTRVFHEPPRRGITRTDDSVDPVISMRLDVYTNFIRPPA